MRCLRRCASSSLPSASSSFSRSVQLGADVAERPLELFGGGDEVLGRVDVGAGALDQHLAGERVELDDALDLVAPELDAHGDIFVGREDLERVAAHAEGAAQEVHVVAVVLDVDQVAQQLVALDQVAPLRSGTVTWPYSSGEPRP